MKKTLLLTIVVFVLLLPAAAFGQGCALCYTQAMGSGAKMIAALKSGILVMVFPPMGICVMLTIMGYRKRNTFHALEPEEQAKQDERPNADLGW